MRGFTLIELVIVIVILSIFTFALVKWPATDTGLYAQARKIASDIRYMQHLSEVKQQRYRINFSENSYTLTDLDNTTPVVQLADNQSTQTLPSNITLTTNLPSKYLVFDMQGVPYIDNQIPGTPLTSTATITLITSGNTETISIYPTTGAVIVSP